MIISFVVIIVYIGLVAALRTRIYPSAPWLVVVMAGCCGLLGLLWPTGREFSMPQAAAPPNKILGYTDSLQIFDRASPFADGIEARGWLVTANGTAPRSIHLTIDGKLARAAITFPLPRPDVAKVFADPARTNVGFELRIVGLHLRGTHRFTLVATGPDGDTESLSSPITFH